jgi:phage-related holin
MHREPVKVLKKLSVVSDGFYWATLHGLLAEGFFFGRFRLFVNVAVTAIIIAFEVGWCRLAAQVAIDALIVHIELARYVVAVFVCYVCHDFLNWI